MSPGQLLLAVLLILLSWHLGLSMELPALAWLGTGLALLGASRLVTVERPTWGLVLVLFASGALTGNQVLEDWALEGSWPQENGFGAGLVIALLLYLQWLYAARPASDTSLPIERESQSIVVWALLALLLIPPADSTVLGVAGIPVPVLVLAGLVLACLAMLADRAGSLLRSSLIVLLPLIVLAPLVWTALSIGQGPVVSTLGNLFPRSSDFSRSGFSPYQTLRASAFVRPSNEPVMRIRSDNPPSPYLAGNRLVSLNEELIWLPSEQPLRSYTTLDAELLPDETTWRYAIDNHHFSAVSNPATQMTIHSLSRDDYLFVTPGTTHIEGQFTAISRNAADVWTPNYERGAEQRWQLAGGGPATPDSASTETLDLPEFWDRSLQSHSESFAAANRQATVDNVVNYFLARDYTLETRFDPERPFHDFFLNDRAAYCFWFASATTLALRANGIPSRLVGGYLMHEQLTEDLWLVRERDAHSWVEWQDSNGYWHTVDPTPASISAFFGGYQSSALSRWYHTLAGRWQLFIDELLANRRVANLITWGGLGILLFLFTREYRRLRQRRAHLDQTSLRWQRLWQRFLKITGLPARPSWTLATYADNLPASWPEEKRARVRAFLRVYQTRRFAPQNPQHLPDMEKALITLKQARDN